MTEYKIACNSGIGDTLTVDVGGEEIGFVAATGDRFRNSVYVNASDARTFARGILALADEVDGGEVKEATPEPESGFKVGDQVRTGRTITTADEGCVGELTFVDADHAPRFQVTFPGGGLVWAYEVEKVTGAPEPLADWERDLLKDEPAATTAPSRAALLEQARQLLDDSATFNADDLIKLADYLAGESA